MKLQRFWFHIYIYLQVFSPIIEYKMKGNCNFLTHNSYFSSLWNNKEISFYSFGQKMEKMFFIMCRRVARLVIGTVLQKSVPHEEMYSWLLSGWWCWIKWRICCCSSGSCWWSVELVRDVDGQTLIRSGELKLMTSGLISGVLAFFFFSGRIQTPGTTFETAALNYYWMPIIVRLTFIFQHSESHWHSDVVIFTYWILIGQHCSYTQGFTTEFHQMSTISPEMMFFIRVLYRLFCIVTLWVTSVVFLKISTQIKLSTS